MAYNGLIRLCGDDGCEWSLCNHTAKCSELCITCPADKLTKAVDWQTAREWWYNQKDVRVVD